MKPTALMTALWLALFVSPLAMATMAKGAGPDCAEKEKQHYGSLKKMKEQLNLTEAQQKTLNEKQAAFGKEVMKKKHAQMDKAQQELKQAIESDASDEKVREKFDALQMLQEDFARTRFEKILLIRSILTPEQRAKFKEISAKE